MYTVNTFQLPDAAVGYVNAVETTMQGMLLVGSKDDALLLLVEAQHVHDHPRATGQLLDQLSAYIIYIQMVVAVALALQQETTVVPRQELDGVQRFDVFVGDFAV